MAKLHRAGWLFMVIIFAVSTFGAIGAVIYQETKEPKKSSEQIDLNNLTKLEGTKMDDFTPITKIDKLETIDTVAGTGEEVKAGDTVTAHYTGAVAATGKVFQSSYDFGSPIAFSLNGVIQGWSEGVPGMKVGGTRRILIPAVQAYGANPPAGSGIPANADLVFDVTIVKIGE